MTDARQGYAPILDQLIELYPTMAESGAFPPIRLGYRAVARIGHGWFLRCQRGVEAILALDHLGYAEEAVGISRSIIEHGVALKWLAAEGDKIWDTLAFGHKYGAEKLLQASSAAGWTSVDPEEIKGAIESVQIEMRDPSNNYLLQFVERNKRYGDVHTLPGYYSSVARVHPTYESAICYIDVPEGTARINSRDSVWQVPFCCTQLHEALLSYRQVFDPMPWETELDELFEQYKAVTDRVREQDGLPPIPWH